MTKVEVIKNLDRAKYIKALKDLRELRDNNNLTIDKLLLLNQLEREILECI